jgi:hypothetical protein
MKKSHHVRAVRVLMGLTCTIMLASCGEHPESAGTKVIYQTVEKEVPRPCPVTKPVKPKPLARPLPVDPARLIDLLAAKLLEWAGPGGYGERASQAIDICTKP